MKKFLKWFFLILVAVFLLLTIGLYVFLAFFAPLDLIKNYVAGRLEAELGLPVTIEKVSSDIFSGIKIQGVCVANPPGYSASPLFYIKSINLKYNLWAILRGELGINQVEIISPSVSIEKNREGELNLRLRKKEAAAPAPAKAEKPAAAPINLLISTVSIKNGEVFYLDASGPAAKKIGVKNLNAKVSNILLSLIKPIPLNASALAITEKAEIPVSLNAKISADLKKSRFELNDLALQIGKELLSGQLIAETAPPQTKLSFTAQAENFSVDNLLKVFGVGAAASKTVAVKEAPSKDLILSVPNTLFVQGSLSVKNLYYKALKISTAQAEVSLKGGRVSINIPSLRAYAGALSLKGSVLLNQPNLGYQIQSLHLKGFDAALFSGDFIESFLPDLPDKKEWKEKFRGQVDFSATGSSGGLRIAELLRRSRIQGALTLRNGKFVHLRSMEEIAQKLKAPSLAQDLAVKEFLTDFKLFDGVLSLDKMHLQDTDVVVDFSGGADLVGWEWKPGNRLKFTLSPALSKTLPAEFELLKNPKGEAEIEFELSGSLKKPLPIPKTEKAVQRAVEKVVPQILDQLKQKIKLPF